MSCAWQRERLAREHRPGRPDRVERIVLALQPPLVSRTTPSLDDCFTAAAQITGKPGTVMAGTLDRPDPHGGRVLRREPHRLCVAASTRPHRSLRDNRAGRRGHDRQHVLVAMGIDTDHVIHLICKHPL